MPSEIQELLWDDVDWEHNTILIKGKKTNSKRLIPVFDEVAGLLLDQFEAAEDGETYVFPVLRKHQNPSTTAKKFVTKAGFIPWDCFWNALRASCETDLMDRYGLRKACRWVGNSPKIAIKHYSLLKKSDYTDGGDNTLETAGLKSGAAPTGNVRN